MTQDPPSLTPRPRKPPPAADRETWAWFAGEAVHGLLCGKESPSDDELDRAAADAERVADRLLAAVTRRFT